jgi:transposase InsO family protein
VIVDQLLKLAHFILCNQTTNVVQVAQLFFQDIYRQHGPPASIISDRDSRFLSHFWRTLWKKVNTNVKFSSAYHPQIDDKRKWLTAR